MILVTGGSGFIGSHTVRALHGLGEPSVVMQRRSGQVPPHLADLPVAAEQADVADLGALRAIGERHEITGIVHLAGYPAPRGTAGGIEATQGLLDGLLNIARVAAEWGVRRVSLASTLGVYGGIAHSGPLTEDLPVLLTAPHPIPRSKKIAELLGSSSRRRPARRSSASGSPAPGSPRPRGPVLRRTRAHPRGSQRQAPGPVRPAHPAAPRRRARPVLRQGHRPRDSADPARRASPAPHLQCRVRPGDHERRGGRSDPRGRARGRTRPPGWRLAWRGAALDITRLRQDTGFEPEYDTVRAAASYIAWLRAGNER